MRDPSGFKPTMRRAAGVKPEGPGVLSSGICIPHFGSERGVYRLERRGLGIGVARYFEGCVGELL